MKHMISTPHSYSWTNPLPTLLAAMLLTGALSAAEPVRIILDTDLASDCDDAGAVAMLNALADAGEAEILGMGICTGGASGVPALDAINAWYGREVPIGRLPDEKFWSGGNPKAPAGAANFESYTPWLAQHCAHRFTGGRRAPTAVALYRRLLAAQPERSVVLCTLGPLINLAALLASPPDAESPLDGRALAARTVRELVVAGGRNPAGTSSNFSKAGAGPYAQAVISGWPTRMVFVGNEVGGSVLTGWRENAANTVGNPARIAYQRFFAGNERAERPSWDQAAVLYAVRGAVAPFTLVEDGRQTCTVDGRNAWVASEEVGRDHAYVRKADGADPLLKRTIDGLMTRTPRHAARPDAGPAALLGRAPVRLILDADMDSDCDDAGALAVLHALADRGEVEPLAIMISGVNPWAGPCSGAINGWYGRPELPIGTARAPAPDQESRYARTVAERLPHRLARSADAPDAVTLYQEVLARQPDGSVTVATIGDMTNLAKLIADPTGLALVRAKVAVWVCMGGNFIGEPARDDLKLGNNNFTLDPGATYAAISGWPTPIVFAGREVCSVPSGVAVGARLAEAPADHPARIAYEAYFGGAVRDRHVADLVAVLVAVRGLGGRWDAQGTGSMALQRDMTFTWDPAGARPQAYLRKRAPDADVEAELNDLLLQPPRKR